MPYEYGSMPTARLIVKGTSDVWVIPSSGRFVVGREPGKAGGVVSAAIDGVSRKHIEVFFITDETVVVRDVGTDGRGTPSGTYVNGDKIDPCVEVRLNHNDTIRLGPLGGVELVLLTLNTYTKKDIVCSDGMVYVKNSRLLPDLNTSHYKIFLTLLEAYPAVVSTKEIGLKGWAPYEPPEDKSIQRTVQRLRNILDNKFNRKNSIPSVHTGYRLELFDQT